MIRAYRAELRKLRRPALLWSAGGLAAALALLGTILVFVRATSGVVRGTDAFSRVSLDRLAGPDGLVIGFSSGLALVGLLMFVLFLTNTSSEYSLGTLRSLLVRQPNRAALLCGKVGALLTVVAGALLVALAVSVVAAVALASARGVPTADWWSVNSLRGVGAGLLNALLGATFWAFAGTALAVVTRSTVIALAIGVAWTFPLEHIIQNAWSGATHWFPGLLFDAVSRGGVPDAPYERALLSAALYAGLAAVVGLASFVRRDVTA